MQNFIGVKQVKAMPMTKGEFHAFKYPNTPINTEVFSGEPSEPGYLVQYEDGYKSWSPKATFEKAYLLQGDDVTKVSQEMVDDFIVSYDSSRSGNHTVVMAMFKNGFTVIEESACVDPNNYNRSLGEQYALEKVKKTRLAFTRLFTGERS